MYCTNHPAAEAIGVCQICGKPICQKCGSILDGALVCRSCIGKGNLCRSPSAAGSPATGQKRDDDIAKVLIFVCIAIFGLGFLLVCFIVLSAVVAAFVFGMTGPAAPHQTPVPAFTANNINDTAVTLTLQDMGGAKSIKGLIVEQPSVAQKIVVSPDTELYIGDSFVISDPGLAGNTHIIVESMVDGNLQVVMDTYA